MKCTDNDTQLTEDWISHKHPEKCGSSPVDCEQQSNQCSTCLSLDPSLECGWCSRRNKCQRRSKCGDSSWLFPGENCTTPQITNFHPLTGPKEGGTEMVIRLANVPANINVRIYNLFFFACFAFAVNIISPNRLVTLP